MPSAIQYKQKEVQGSKAETKEDSEPSRPSNPDAHAKSHAFDKKTIMNASLLGELDVVRQALDSGIDINVKNKEGNTPLHWASRGGHLHIVRELLSRGADIEAKNDEGNTSLHWACYTGQTEVTRELVKNGATMFTNNRGENPMDHALQGWNTEGVIQYLEQVFSRQRSVLHVHDYRKRRTSIEAVPSIMSSLKENNKLRLRSREAPIDRRSCVSDTTEIDLVIKHLFGDDLLGRNNYGNTPLHWASSSGRVNIVQRLLDRHVNINAKNSDGDTPLHVASYNGEIAVVRELVSRGAHISSRNRRGETPFDQAFDENQK